jgi:hypothetical protein
VYLIIIELLNICSNHIQEVYVHLTPIINKIYKCVIVSFLVKIVYIIHEGLHISGKILIHTTGWNASILRMPTCGS